MEQIDHYERWFVRVHTTLHITLTKLRNDSVFETKQETEVRTRVHISANAEITLPGK